MCCKDLMETQQLTGIEDNNTSSQCEIILATIEGPNVLVAANSVQKIVNKSPNSNTMMQQMLSLAEITTGTRSSSLKPERWIFC